MKNIIEYMTTFIIVLVSIFVLTTTLTIGTQIDSARKAYTSVVNAFQSSYYTKSEAELNKALHKSYSRGCLIVDGELDETDSSCEWNVSIEDKTTLDARKNYVVTLNYTIHVPIFNITKQSSITGDIR